MYIVHLEVDLQIEGSLDRTQHQTYIIIYKHITMLAPCNKSLIVSEPEDKIYCKLRNTLTLSHKASNGFNQNVE